MMILDEMAHIGGGAFGDVFLLKEFNPPIVMKEVAYSCNLIDQEEEMKILKELVDENIVKFMDQPLSFEYNGGRFPIFMEYCDEGSLRDVISDVTLNYSMSTLTKWAIEIFAALIYLKSKRIAHRDVKPGNIFVTGAFHLKLGDFGVCERFVDDGKRIAFAGTERYMAPELFNDIDKLTEMDFYQCDVFASGLVLWETTMRKNLPTKSNSLTFPGTTSTDVKMFFEIIQRCSSPKICIKSRSKAEDALFEVEELNKKFNTFIQKPYRDQNQKWIELPEGLCIETTTSGSTFMVPDGLSLEMGSVKRTKSTQVDPTIDATLQNQFNQWISKAERKSNFENLMGKLQDGEDILPVYFYNFLALPESIKCFDDEKFEDVNLLREKLRNAFLKALPSKDFSISEKRELLAHLKAMHNQYAEKFSGWSARGDIRGFYSSYTKFEAKEKLPKESLHYILKLYSKLLDFDFALQDFCFEFALHTLWKCQSRNFSSKELLMLLNIGIENIEQLGDIYTKRRQFNLVYYVGSRATWGHCFELAFTKDLREIRKGDNICDLVHDSSPFIVDLEEIRRVLHKKKAEISKFHPHERKRTSETLSEFLVHQHELLQMYEGIKQSTFPRSELEWLLKALIISGKSRFPGYIYILDIIERRDVAVKCHCPTICPKKALSTKGILSDIGLQNILCKEKDNVVLDAIELPEELLKIELEVVEKNWHKFEETLYDQYEDNIFKRFPGLITEYSAKYQITSICGCPIQCATKKFPENAIHSLFQFEYSTCSKLNQLEFLETHSLFEQSFRLLDEWEQHMDSPTIYLYLIESLLLKLSEKKDPSYGFCFIMVKQVDYKKAEAKRRTCEHMRAEGRCGLLLKLTLLDKGMSFWNKNFSLEDCCDRCMAEYVDLIYISLYELSDLLEVRQRFLRDRWIMKQTPMSVEVFQQIEVRKKQHIEEMEMGIEKFWKRRIIE